MRSTSARSIGRFPSEPHVVGDRVSAWKRDELESISGVDEVQVASRRTGGSLRPFVTVWAVRHGDDVYVRSAHGPQNGWFVRAVASGEGRLHAGRVERGIIFERPDASVDAGVDSAYHAKYDRYGPSTVGTVVGPDRPDHASARAGIGARASADRPRSLSPAPRRPRRDARALRKACARRCRRSTPRLPNRARPSPTEWWSIEPPGQGVPNDERQHG